MSAEFTRLGGFCFLSSFFFAFFGDFLSDEAEDFFLRFFGEDLEAEDPLFDSSPTTSRAFMAWMAWKSSISFRLFGILRLLRLAGFLETPFCSQVSSVQPALR